MEHHAESLARQRDTDLDRQHPGLRRTTWAGSAASPKPPEEVMNTAFC
jgi:hypothetical protein